MRRRKSFFKIIPEIKPALTIEQSIWNRIGPDPDFLKRFPIPATWFGEVQKFADKSGYLSAFKALALIDLWRLGSGDPRTFLRIAQPSSLYDLFFEQREGWRAHHSESGMTLVVIPAEIFPQFKRGEGEFLLALFADPHVSASEDLFNRNVLAEGLPVAFLSFTKKDGSPSATTMQFPGSITTERRRVSHSLIDLLIAGFENYVYDRFLNGHWGKEIPKERWEEPLRIAYPKDALSNVRGAEDIAQCLRKNGYRRSPTLSGGVTKIIVERSYDATLEAGLKHSVAHAVEAQFLAQHYFPSFIKPNFVRDYFETKAAWEVRKLIAFEHELSSLPYHAIPVASLADRSVVVRKGFNDSVVSLRRAKKLTRQLLNHALLVPVQTVDVFDTVDVTTEEERIHSSLINKYGYQIAPEILSTQYAWMSKGVLDPKERNSWKDLLKRRAPGVHLLYLHYRDQNRHPAIVAVSCDQNGYPQKTVWIGHKGGGLGYFDPSDVSIDKGFARVKSIIYRRSFEERWSEDTSRSMWGGMTLNEGKESYLNARQLAVLFEEGFKDNIQRIPIPFDTVAIESLPFWMVGDHPKRPPGWFRWDIYVKGVLSLGNRSHDFSRPAIHRSLSKCGLRVGGLVNAIFSRTEESSTNLSLAKSEIDDALRYLYFQHQQPITLPGHGVRVRAGQCGPAEVAAYLKQVSEINGPAAHTIYNNIAYTLLSSAGFVHGTEGDVGGSMVPGKAGGAGAGGAVAIRNVDIHGMMHDLSGVQIGKKCGFVSSLSEEAIKQHEDRHRRQRADLMHLHHTLYWVKTVCLGREVPGGTNMVTEQRGWHNYITYFGEIPSSLSHERLALDKVNDPGPQDVVEFARGIFGKSYEFEIYRKSIEVGAQAKPVDSQEKNRQLLMAKIEEMDSAIGKLSPVPVGKKTAESLEIAMP